MKDTLDARFRRSSSPILGPSPGGSTNAIAASDGAAKRSRGRPHNPGALACKRGRLFRQGCRGCGRWFATHVHDDNSDGLEHCFRTRVTAPIDEADQCAAVPSSALTGRSKPHLMLALAGLSSHFSCGTASWPNLLSCTVRSHETAALSASQRSCSAMHETHQHPPFATRASAYETRPWPPPHRPRPRDKSPTATCSHHGELATLHVDTTLSSRPRCCSSLLHDSLSACAR